LASTAPEHALRYAPTGLDEDAAVEHVGAVVNEVAVSPFTKPEYDAVMVGAEPP
jgi:hypothetical protein